LPQTGNPGSGFFIPLASNKAIDGEGKAAGKMRLELDVSGIRRCPRFNPSFTQGMARRHDNLTYTLHR